MERWRAASASYRFTEAQARKLKQIRERCQVASVLVRDADGTIYAGGEMVATGRERSYEIAPDGKTEARWTYA